MTDFTCDVDADGVALITWDAQGRSMNVLTREAFALLDRLVDRRWPIRRSGASSSPAARPISPAAWT